MEVHRLSEKDTGTLTATCSVCGLVAIRKSGTGYQCAVKKAATHKSWASRNPDKAAANRQASSEHRIFDRDYVALTAKCSVCGPVDLLPYGRGYACGNRARELRSVQEDGVQRHCSTCWMESSGARGRRRVYLLADGTCPRCDDDRALDTGAALRDLEHAMTRGAGGTVPAGFHVVHEGFDPYAVDDYESAVPGWRVLGSDRPWNEA